MTRARVSNRTRTALAVTRRTVNAFHQAAKAARMMADWTRAWPNVGVYLEKLRALPAAPTAVFTAHARRPPRGPAKRDRQVGMVAVAPEELKEIGKIMKCADDAGYFQEFIRSSGLFLNIPPMATGRSRKRAALARVTERAGDELLAEQYPGVKTFVYWKTVDGPMLGRLEKMFITYRRAK